MEREIKRNKKVGKLHRVYAEALNAGGESLRGAALKSCFQGEIPLATEVTDKALGSLGPMTVAGHFDHGLRHAPCRPQTFGERQGNGQPMPFNERLARKVKRLFGTQGIPTSGGVTCRLSAPRSLWRARPEAPRRRRGTGADRSGRRCSPREPAG